MYSATDPDGEEITWSVTGGDAAHFVIDDQGALAFLASPNFESPVDADRNNAYVIQIVVSDDGNESSLDVVVEVTDANDAPRFPSAAIVVEIPENSCPGAHTLYRGIGDGVGFETDEDGDPLTYALFGPDARFFVIHPPTGYVTLGPNKLLDFEASRKPFMLRVSVSDRRDNLGNTESEFNPDDYLDLTVMIKDVDEPPVFTEARLVLDVCGNPVGHEPGQLRRAVTSGARGGSRVEEALSVIDPEGESVHFRIVSQSDQGAFIIDSTSGQIMVAPNFSPRDARRVYRLRVAATDGELESQIEVRIAVRKAPKSTPAPDVEDSSTPNPESADDAELSTPVQSTDVAEDSSPPDIEESSTSNEESVDDAEVATPVQSTEVAEDSSSPDESDMNLLTTPEIIPWLPVNLRRVEPVFVPVLGAAQVSKFAAKEVSDETGRAHLTAPAATLAVPYQVRLMEDEIACSELLERTKLLECVCVSVEFFDVEGAPLAQESLNRPALLEIVLRTQDEAGDAEIGRECAGISRDSVELMMRQDDEQEWAYTHGDLREPVDGSSILMVQVRSPGQYMALVTESGTEREAPATAAPMRFVKTVAAQQAQNTVAKSVIERTVSFVYDPIVAQPQSQPAPTVSAEPPAWHMARLLIALLLDVTVALSAGIILQRVTFRRH